MILKKPIPGLNLRRPALSYLALSYLVTILCFEGLVYANSVPRVVTGFVVEKQDLVIVIQQDKKTLVPVNINDIATVAVLDSRKLSRGVLGAMGVGPAAGGITVAIMGHPRNTREVFKGIAVGAILIPLKFAYNWWIRKEPRIIFHVNGAGTKDVEIIKNILLGTKVRITSKNHL